MFFFKTINNGSYITICTLKTNSMTMDDLNLLLHVDKSAFKSVKCYNGNTYEVI